MISLDRLAWFVGEVARPMAILTTSTAASIATVIIAQKVVDGNDGFIFIGGVFAGVAVILGAKAAEEWGKDRNASKVEIARVGGDRSTPLPVTIENRPGDSVPVEEAHPVNGD